MHTGVMAFLVVEIAIFKHVITRKSIYYPMFTKLIIHVIIYP